MEVKEEDENNYISYDLMDKKTNYTVEEQRNKKLKKKKLTQETLLNIQ